MIIEREHSFAVLDLTQNFVPAFRHRLSQYAVELRPRVVMQRWE
jgi:hypothetical protein